MVTAASVGPPVLLVGATSAVGQELLLRLALAGFEVVAHVPDDDEVGQTGEYACRVVRGAAAHVVSAEPGALVVEVDAKAHRVTLGGATSPREVAYAPLMTEVVAAVRGAPWYRLVRDPWSGDAMPLVHPRDVAEAVVRLVRQDLVCTGIGGPERVTWRTVVAAVLDADARQPWWRPLVGRWPIPRGRAAGSWPGGPSAAVAAEFPGIGRRRLADVLARRDSGAMRPVSLLASAPPPRS